MLGTGGHIPPLPRVMLHRRSSYSSSERVIYVQQQLPQANPEITLKGGKTLTLYLKINNQLMGCLKLNRTNFLPNTCNGPPPLSYNNVSVYKVCVSRINIVRESLRLVQLSQSNFYYVTFKASYISAFDTHSIPLFNL